MFWIALSIYLYLCGAFVDYGATIVGDYEGERKTPEWRAVLRAASWPIFVTWGIAATIFNIITNNPQRDL